MKKEYEKLKKENEELKQKLDKQGAQTDYIIDIATKAANERDASEENLKCKYDKLEKCNLYLQECNNQFKNNNQNLLGDNDRLYGVNSKLVNDNQLLESKNKDLKDQVANIASLFKKLIDEHVTKRKKDLVFGVVLPSIGVGAFIVLLTCSLPPVAFLFTGIIGLVGLAPTIIAAIHPFISGKEDQMQEFVSQYPQYDSTQFVTPQGQQCQVFNNNINNNNDNLYINNYNQNQSFGNPYQNQMYSDGMNMNNGLYQPMVNYEQSNVNNYPIINQ